MALEHLLSPEFDDIEEMDAPTLLSAQATTASFFDEIGSPEHLLEEDTKQKARSAFVAVTNTNVPDADKKAALTALRVPEAVKHLAGMLSAYDWEFVAQAKELRGYVVAKLLEETTHPDAKIRLKSLELVGRLTEVGSFTERIQVTKVDATSDELQERIKAKLANLLPKTIEVQDATPKESANGDQKSSP